MKEIIKSYQNKIKTANSIEEKLQISAELQKFYQSLSIEQKSELAPFLDELKASTKKTINKLDSLAEKAEFLLQKMAKERNSTLSVQQMY